MKKSRALAIVGTLLLAATALTPAAWSAAEGHGTHRPHDRAHARAPLDGCTDAALLFCEDFDSLPTGQAQGPGWDTVATGGTLTVEDSATGGKDLHITTEGNGSAFLRVGDFAPPGNSFWGRVRLRVDAFPTAPDWAHWTMVEATGQDDGLIRPLGGQYVPDVGTNLWGVGSDGGRTGDWTAWQESVPAEAGTWRCVEWEMDAAENRVSLWMDGSAKPDLTVDTDTHGGDPVDFVFPRFDTVKLGWQLYQQDPTPASYGVRLDDIALGADRVGCADTSF